MEELEIPDEIYQYADEKDEYLNKAHDDFFMGWDLIELAIFLIVWNYVSKFETQNGKYVFNDKNVGSVAGINTIAAEAIQKSDYPIKVKQYLDSYAGVSSYNVQIHGPLNGLTERAIRELITPVERQAYSIALNAFTGGGITSDFIEPLRVGIYKNIVAGATVTEMEAFIKEFIVSSNVRQGRLLFYAGRIARDAIFQYDGQINAQIAQNIEANAYLYIGGLVKDSRPQCIRWDGKKYLLFSELEQEINGAFNYGRGMIPGTNPENFPIYRGGHNCRHSTVPFKIS